MPILRVGRRLWEDSVGRFCLRDHWMLALDYLITISFEDIRTYYQQMSSFLVQHIGFTILCKGKGVGHNMFWVPNVRVRILKTLPVQDDIGC